MATEELSRCPGSPPGETMLKDGDVRGIFALKRRGWAIKAIARELGIVPKTVRSCRTAATLIRSFIQASIPS